MLQKWLTWLSSRICFMTYFSLLLLLTFRIFSWQQRTSKLYFFKFLSFNLLCQRFQTTLLNLGLLWWSKRLSKHQNLTHWLEVLAKVLNMLIGLKGNNYYSKVFKRVNYKLWNSTFWVVITPSNRHIASPLAMKERKIKINITIIYNIMLITSKKKKFKWHDDLTLTWNIK